MRTVCLTAALLLSCLGHAQSIADLARKAEAEKDPFSQYETRGSVHNGLVVVAKPVDVGDGEMLTKFGVVDEQGTTVYIPCEYDRLTPFREGSGYHDYLYIAEKNGRKGLVNASNVTLLSCDYTDFDEAGNGILRTRKTDKYGYVELQGTGSATTLIPCVYDHLGGYEPDGPVRATYKGMTGLLDGHNKTVLSFVYDKISDFQTVGNTRLAWLKREGKYGICDKDGKIVQACYIEGAYTMSAQGVASALDYSSFPAADTHPYVYFKSNGLVGLLSSRTYEVAVPCIYEYLAPVISDKVFYKVSGKWGIVDVQNRTVQQALYDKVEVGGECLSEKNIPVQLFRKEMRVHADGKYGMLDKNGQSLVPVKYDSIGVYSEDRVVAMSNHMYGYVDAQGKEIVPLTYTYAAEFSEGLAAVRNDKGKYLFIDPSGTVVFGPKSFDTVGKFRDGVCLVTHKDKSWMIDRQGKKVKEM